MAVLNLCKKPSHDGKSNDDGDFWGFYKLKSGSLGFCSGTTLRRGSRSCGDPTIISTYLWNAVVRKKTSVVSSILDVHPYLGKIPILTNIFQMGWNHQLVNNLRSWPFFGVILVFQKDTVCHHCLPCWGFTFVVEVLRAAQTLGPREGCGMFFPQGDTLHGSEIRARKPPLGWC